MAPKRLKPSDTSTAAAYERLEEKNGDAAADASAGQASVLRFGEFVKDDKRLMALHDRESFFLRVLIPRQPSWKSFVYVIWSQITAWRGGFMLLCLTIYSSALYMCSHETSMEQSFCTGGPSGFGFGDLRSGMLNSLATLLLSFYASTAVGLYQAAYCAAQEAKNSVSLLVNLGVGTIVRDGAEREARARELLFDLWRCVNVMHVTTYVVSDKSRSVYSYERFFLPVCEAYGPHDAEMAGMLRRDEWREMAKGLSKLRAMQGKPGGDPLVDMRGDVRSDVAQTFSAFQVRLYRLASELIDQKLTSAPWPTWGATLLKMSDAMLDLQRRALYRMNKVYETSIISVVLTTLLYDSFVLGTVVGEHYQLAYRYAWFTTALATLLLLALIFLVTLIVGSCIHMEEPFGKDPMDLPGLSYVTAAAEATLRQCDDSSGGSDGGKVPLHGLRFRLAPG